MSVPFSGRKEATNFAVEITHQSGIVTDVWEMRIVGESALRYFVVLRDRDKTEIGDRRDWEQYVAAHEELIQRRAGPPADSGRSLTIGR